MTAFSLTGVSPHRSSPRDNSLITPPQGCFLLLLGRLADIYGRRNGYLIGAVWFSAWSIACGLAQTGLQLSIFRALQGIGTAAMIPSAVSPVIFAFDEEC